MNGRLAISSAAQASSAGTRPPTARNCCVRPDPLRRPAGSPSAPTSKAENVTAAENSAGPAARSDVVGNHLAAGAVRGRRRPTTLWPSICWRSTPPGGLRSESAGRRRTRRSSDEIFYRRLSRRLAGEREHRRSYCCTARPGNLCTTAGPPADLYLAVRAARRALWLPPPKTAGPGSGWEAPTGRWPNGPASGQPLPPIPVSASCARPRWSPP